MTEDDNSTSLAAQQQKQKQQHHQQQSQQQKRQPQQPQQQAPNPDEPIQQPLLLLPRLGPSSPERKKMPKTNKSGLEPVVEGAQKLQVLRDTPPPGTSSNSNNNRIRKAASKPELSKQRSAYFEETFASKEMDLLGDLVRSEAIVMAEIKTNVIVHDEYTFVRELSQHLAVRYHRQVGSVVVTLRHSACIFFGGSSDPSYIMTVEALEGLVQAATNRRNVALLQQHMEQALGVAPARGYCRFVPIAEECSGWKGRTVASQIAAVSGMGTAGGEKEREARERMVKEEEARGVSPSRADARTDSRGTADRDEPALDTSPEYRLRGNDSAAEARKPRGLRRRKSFMHSLFTRSGSRSRDAEGART